MSSETEDRFPELTKMMARMEKDPKLDPCHGKHFVPAPEGYPIRGVWVDQGKTVHYIKPGAKAGEHYMIGAVTKPKPRW